MLIAKWPAINKNPLYVVLAVIRIGNFPLTNNARSNNCPSHCPGSYPASNSHTKFLTSIAITYLICLSARTLPTQFAGPIENGMNAARSRTIGSEPEAPLCDSARNQRSGQNSLGLGEK